MSQVSFLKLSATLKMFTTCQAQFLALYTYIIGSSYFSYKYGEV